ncbi:leucine-rich repeat domain-containing protein [Streptomyces phaeochromogenes]|uniref:leucine-rich repeat domain-containing protein n=1 Tax=Streptomyces phaeochromogenes TaxID=1923 RepID=UPI0036BD7FBB
MTFAYHLQTFADMPVIRWNHPRDSPLDPAKVAWRIDSQDDEDPQSDEGSTAEALESVLDRTGPEGPVALVVGYWEDAFDSPFDTEWFLGNLHRLRRLRALFLGDINYADDGYEMHAITLMNLTPLLEGLPDLEVLGVRGSKGLEFMPMRHEKLRTLVFQSNGMPAEAVRCIAASDFPALTHLELWTGAPDYDPTASPDDLAPILDGRSLPSLKYLGLRAAEIADDYATALASAPVVARLTDLDLSLGTFGNTGAEALLAGQPLSHLESLRLRHHYMTSEVAQRLVDELPGVHVDISDGQEEAIGGDNRATRSILDSDEPIRHEDYPEWYAQRRKTLERLLAEAERE